MGPGNRFALPKNDEQTKLRAKEKVLLDGIRYKSDFLKIGDWVHLSNPDNPGRPIVGQIFNTYKRLDNQQRMVNACWYYRPEETVHHISRIFIENEVFKTGNFIDHAIEDVLGRCLALFYTKYLRGRPSAPLFTPDLPLYVCEHRYKDDDYNFKKIKNWESSGPSNLRTAGHEENFQSFSYPQLSSTMVRVDSPFLVPATEVVQGNGEPIILSPTELAKVLPKDQVKYHKQDLTLEMMRSIMGVLPTIKPRPPHTHTTTRSPDSSAPQTPRTRSAAPTANASGASMPASKPVVANPNPSTPAPQNSAPLKPKTPPLPPPPAASVVPTTTRPPNLPELSTGPLRELLRQLNPSRKTPCLLDLYASQKSFEKLPDIFLSQNCGSEDCPNETRAKATNELVWVAAPPCKPHLPSSPTPLRHSPAYLAYLAKQEAEQGSEETEANQDATEKAQKHTALELSEAQLQIVRSDLELREHWNTLNALVPLTRMIP